MRGRSSGSSALAASSLAHSSRQLMVWGEGRGWLGEMMQDVNLVQAAADLR